MLGNITLMVPTYERPAFIKRLIWFYSRTTIRILIADGSKKQSLSELDCEKMPDSIQYLHQPGVPFRKRLEWLAQNISTPYVAWLGDDEFQLPSGLLASANILHDQLDIATAIGMCAGFKYKKNGIYGGHVYEYTPKIYKHTTASRVEDYFLHYSPTLSYALWRTDLYLEAQKVFLLKEWGSGNLGEFIHAFCGIVSGSHVIHNKLQWLRSDENPPQQADLKRDVGVADWMIKSSYKEERTYLKACLLRYIASICKIDINKANDLIELAFSAYCYGALNNSMLVSLGLKPGKNYNRDYSQSLEDYLRSAELMISEREMRLLSIAISKTCL